MTSIIRATDLAPQELQQLGTNLAATVRRDPAEIEAMNRSLATLGEKMEDEVEEAIRSEQVAS